MIHLKTFAFIGALSVTLVSTVAARQQQAQESDESKMTTIVGCLEKNNSGGFWLTKGMMSSSATNRSTATSGAAQDRTAGSNMGKGTVYNLENGTDLDKHVGHKIEVSGRLDDDTSGDKPAGAGDGSKEIKARDFHVKSMKMISTTCS